MEAHIFGAPANRTGRKPRGGQATKTVLVAEDDRVTAKLLEHRLGKEPELKVVHCADGLDAWDVAAKEEIALAILDVQLPGLDGFALLSRLRESPRTASVPVIMLTSLADEEDVVRGLELGANDYVVKPFSPAELMARVRRLLLTDW